MCISVTGFYSPIIVVIMKASNVFKQTIQTYLENRAKSDELFAASYAKPNKNIDECCNFILGEVQKSGCNGFSDDEIFSMAIHYYDEDGIKNVEPVNARVVINHVVELTEEEKKAAEYSARLCNQSGTYTKGEIETAYVTGAVESMSLQLGETGSFGQVIPLLQNGYCIARKEWGNKCFIVKQVNADIATDVVPKMQSLPGEAKRIIGKSGDGSIHYREQCLVVYPDNEEGCVATSYVPDWQDVFANDWMIVE